jgi:hypothetical protein
MMNLKIKLFLPVLFPLFLAGQTGIWGVTQLPQPASYLQAATSGDKAFFLGFNNGYLYIYDEPTNYWSTITLPNTKMQPSIGALGSKIYISGDSAVIAGMFVISSPSRTIYVYDYVNDSWSVEYLSTTRRQVKICSLGSKIYFTGGYIDGGGPMGGSSQIGQSTVDIYDSSSDNWSVIHMPNGRLGHTAYAQDDKVFIGGGVDANVFGNATFMPTDIYSPATNTWTTYTPSMVSNFIALSGIDTTVFMFYGKNLMNNTSHANYEQYDLSAEQWSAHLFATTGDRKSAIAGSDRVFTGGGDQYLDVYYAPSHSFYTDSLALKRDYICFASVNKKVLFAGGTLSNGNPTDHVDIFVDTTATIGIKKKQEAIQLNIFPNPADNLVIIDLGSKTQSAQLQLTDISGKEVQTVSIANTGRFDLNTSTLANGIYLLKVQTGQHSVQQKIVIVH